MVERRGYVPSVKLTASLHLKMDGWKTIFLGQPAAFSGAKMLLVWGGKNYLGLGYRGATLPSFFYTKEKGFGKIPGWLAQTWPQLESG